MYFILMQDISQQHSRTQDACLNLPPSGVACRSTAQADSGTEQPNQFNHRDYEY